MSYLAAKLHNQDGPVEPSDLTTDGRREAAHQCYRLLEELVDADRDDPASEERGPLFYGLDFKKLDSPSP